MRLLRSSRFALTLPDQGVFPRGALETGRSCARMAKVVFISCHGCFLFNETYPPLYSCAKCEQAGLFSQFEYVLIIG